MNITCPHCSSDSVLKNAERFYGKKVHLRCANAQCGKSFEYEFFVDRSDDTTFISPITTSISNKIQLRVMKEDNTLVKIINLRNSDYIIGRETQSGSSCESIVIDDPYISRKHCFLKCINHTRSNEYIFSIHDLNSTNCTILNGRELNQEEEIYLSDGDVIKIGKIHILYRVLNSTHTYENI